MVDLDELKELQRVAADVADTVAEISRKVCEISVRLHGLIEEEQIKEQRLSEIEPPEVMTYRTSMPIKKKEGE